MRCISRLELFAICMSLAACTNGDSATTSRTTLPAVAASIPTADAATVAAQLSAQRVWQPGDQDDPYDVSPDGRTVAFIDWKTGNLMVRDLASGTNRDVTRKGTYEQSKSDAQNAVFSRDGRQIAYEWYDSPTDYEEVRVINVDGSGVHAIFRGATVSDGVWPAEWTVDGKYVVTILTDDGIRRIALVPTSGGAPQIVKTIPSWQRVHIMIRISPDGRYLAYTAPTARNELRRDIFLVSVADGSETPIAQHAADDYPVGWTRDGSQLVFASDRAGSPGLWTQHVKDGHAIGEPSLVRGDLWHLVGNGLARLTTAGAFLYEVRVGDRDIYTAAFDAETGRLQSPPVSVTPHAGEDYAQPQWSADGRYVSYLTLEPRNLRFTTITTRSFPGDEVRMFRPQLTSLDAFAWIPHTQSLMLSARAESGPQGYYRFDLGTSNTTLLLSNTWGQVPAISPDGSVIYYSPRPVPHSDTLPARVFSRDLATGRVRQLYSAPHPLLPVAVTPDGRTVITIHREVGRGGFPSGVVAIPTARGGAAIELGETIPFDRARQTMRPLGLTPDGNSEIIMTQRNDSLDVFALWRVPLAGGRAVRLAQTPREIREGALLSPDGRHILFTAGKLQTEVWSLDAPALRGGPAKPTPR